MGNAQLVAKVTADALGEDQWLRYVATGNSPGRPNGSAVVLLTRTQLDVVELGLDRPPLPLRLDELQGISQSEGRRLWRSITDLRFETVGQTVTIEGMFTATAESLIEMVSRDIAGQLRGGS
jgi:hypothetical protein